MKYATIIRFKFSVKVDDLKFDEAEALAREIQLDLRAAVEKRGRRIRAPFDVTVYS